MKTITLTNDFHGQSVTLRLGQRNARGGWPLSQGQIRRARQELCGIAGCTCGGLLGERGRQDVEIVLGAWQDEITLYERED